jgi:HlyD family secretion protein
MKKIIHFKKLFLFTALLTILPITACQGQATPAPAPTTSETASNTSIAMASTGGSIKALGTIKPARQLDLSFTASGPVEMIQVDLGSPVKANDVLAQLDTSDLALSLQDAQANVASQQATLDELITGNAQQIAQAEINLQNKALQLEKTRLESPDAAVAVAQATIDELNLKIDQNKVQDSSADIAAAEAELRSAEATHGQAKEKYEQALKHSWVTQPELDQYGLDLNQAEANLKRAQATLAAAQNKQQAHGLGVDALQAQKAKANAELNQQLNNQQAYRVTLSILATDVEAAQLELANLQAQLAAYQDASDETLTPAEVKLHQAQLAVDKLEQQLQETNILAPFDGIVSAVHLQPGAWAEAGAPVVEMIDTTRWLVETKNVSELDIGRVKIGQEAIVRVPALDETVQGKVIAISPVAVVQQGDTTYSLIIELDETDLDLLPGMNTQVEIVTDKL